MSLFLVKMQARSQETELHPVTRNRTIGKLLADFKMNKT